MNCCSILVRYFLTYFVFWLRFCGAHFQLGGQIGPSKGNSKENK